MENTVLVKKVHKDAIILKRSTTHAAGYDLYTIEDGKILPKNKSIIRTGIAVRMPKLPEPFHIYGRIASRSGLSAKFSLETGAGVIDYDYDKELKIILHNHGDEAYYYNKGDRIAQLIFEIHLLPKINEVINFEDLYSNRVDGFGSTGV